MSFGSVIKSSTMPQHKRDMFITVFKNLRQRVIWKWEETLPGLPDNVLIAPWLPQQDILAHKNVRLVVQLLVFLTKS